MIEPDVTRLSPNFSASPPTQRLVVIHATRSGKSMNPTEFEGTLNWFSRTDSQVSAHWVIGRDGKKARVVSDGQQAWHAGEHNVGWGIELEQGVSDDGFTKKQLASLLDVCAGYVLDFGVPPVHTLDAGQIGFIGHEETKQGKRVGKSDPGPKFDWNDFIADLKRRTAPTPDGPAGLDEFSASEISWALTNLQAYALGELLFPEDRSLPRLEKIHPRDLAIVEALVAEARKRQA
jgi:N-acetyl-anhydromuramyl-L-alanine amidase AmpD